MLRSNDVFGRFQDRMNTQICIYIHYLKTWIRKMDYTLLWACDGPHFEKYILQQARALLVQGCLGGLKVWG